MLNIIQGWVALRINGPSQRVFDSGQRSKRQMTRHNIDGAFTSSYDKLWQYFLSDFYKDQLNND